MRLWNLETGSEVRKFSRNGHLFYSLAVSPDEKFLFAGGGWTTNQQLDVQDIEDVLSFKGRVICWDLSTGEEQYVIDDHEQTVSAVALSRDGTKLVTGSFDTRLLVRNSATGEQEQELIGHARPITAVAVSSDEDLKVFSVSGPLKAPTANELFDEEPRFVGGLSIWNATSGERMANEKAHEATTNAVLFLGANRILTAGADRVIGVWDVATAQRVLTLSGHADQVLALAMSHDGEVLVSGAQDGQILVWDGRISDRLRNSGFNPPEAMTNPAGQ